MPFALQYKSLIESETSISKTLVLPRNVYRINSYKYSDGKQKTLSGTTSTIVFVVLFEMPTGFFGIFIKSLSSSLVS